MAIPKIIHYCWFGDNEPPKIVSDCLSSWKEFLPDYEIKRWDESNYDVNKIPFTKGAYKYRDFAFVSDYARHDILSEYGGIYLDTDVLLIKDLTPLIEKGPFGGVNLGGKFASGLVLAAEPNMPIIKELKEIYENTSYTFYHGQPHLVNCTTRETDVLVKHDFVIDPNRTEECNVAGLTIYPKDYFCAYNPSTGKTDITDNTYAIHQFTGTWMPSWLRKREMMRSEFVERHYKNIYGTE